jgi:hypothetical protein
MLSGTLTSETWSQIYPILNTSSYTPFEETSFRKFAEKYVNIKSKYIKMNVAYNKELYTEEFSQLFNSMAKEK